MNNPKIANRFVWFPQNWKIRFLRFYNNEICVWFYVYIVHILSLGLYCMCRRFQRKLKTYRATAKLRLAIEDGYTCKAMSMRPSAKSRVSKRTGGPASSSPVELASVEFASVRLEGTYTCTTVRGLHVYVCTYIYIYIYIYKYKICKSYKIYKNYKMYKIWIMEIVYTYT